MLDLPVKPEIVKPVVKWAGGKRQLLPELRKRVPKHYGQYIEPFVGGGALFFDLQPTNAVLADANIELITLYDVIANELDELIQALKLYKNDEECFYAARSLDADTLSCTEAAARTLYLNRTCFNGLYRVNKKGQFNVPFGKYVNPTICDEPALRSASSLLKRSTILSGDYKKILQCNAKTGDFIFLDPPYMPVSTYSDFKRYTKEQFVEQDHIDLADEVKRLHDLGCHILLTNSDNELVHELYKPFKIDVVASKRNINSKGNKRTGKDVIVSAIPKTSYNSASVKTTVQHEPENETVPEQLTFQSFKRTEDKAKKKSTLVGAEQIAKFPPTRFMGSKSKVLDAVQDSILSVPCDTVLDLFSGSGIVSYMLKSCGKTVISNDFMAFSATMAKALIENSHAALPEDSAKALLQPNHLSDHFVERTFEGLYFTTQENRLIDDIRANIKSLDDDYLQAIAISALVRACFKKRPRGIFTYVGHRYDDGRKDLQTSLSDHFLTAVETLNNAVFDNGKVNTASRMDALQTHYEPDLVYIDPPYYSPHSDNEYVRRYHFVEGIACDWEGVEIQMETKTKKFKNYPTPFSTKKGTYTAFEQLFDQYKNSKMVVSYSSNSQPNKEEMIALLRQFKSAVDVVSVDHRYSFGNQAHKVNDNKNKVSEYLFVAT